VDTADRTILFGDDHRAGFERRAYSRDRWANEFGDFRVWPISTDASDVADVGFWGYCGSSEHHPEAWAASCAPLGSRCAGGYEGGKIAPTAGANDRQKKNQTQSADATC
jgi:hypothetical protein